MWDMSRFVMIVILSLHRGETLSFGAYKLLVTLLSRDSGGYSGVYENKSVLNDVFCRHHCSFTCWHVTQLDVLRNFSFRLDAT